jgi:asparagine synthase (glutamine-hydrolysing)
LLADPSVERRVNLRAVDRFMTYYYLPGNETMFEGVFKLEPGHFLMVLDGQIKKEQYWDLVFPRELSKKSFCNSVHDLRSLLSRTVKDHMISDVPVGVLLSGGVDSTGVLRYAAEQTDRPVHSFTIGFDGQDFADERPYAKLAAKTYGTKHREITITSKDFEDFLPKYVWHMEEPVCEPPAVALYFVSRLARESGVKVLLSGEGGDEAFGGYQNYRNLLFLERLKTAFGPARAILRFGLEAFGRVCWDRALSYARLVDLPLSKYYLSRTATFSPLFDQVKEAFYSRDFKEQLGDGEPDLPTQRLFDRLIGASPLNQMLYVDTKTWLPDDLLIKADKITMATSVELRVPLLDFQVLEFAASLPQDFKVKGLTTKRILKAALEKSVPQEILNRKKTGFPVPYSDWLRRDMRQFVFDTVSGQNSMLRAYFNKTKVDEILQAHQRGEVYSKEVFCLLVLELWHHAFISKMTSIHV